MNWPFIQSDLFVTFKVIGTYESSGTEGSDIPSLVFGRESTSSSGERLKVELVVEV